MLFESEIFVFGVIFDFLTYLVFGIFFLVIERSLFFSFTLFFHPITFKILRLSLYHEARKNVGRTQEIVSFHAQFLPRVSSALLPGYSVSTSPRSPAAYVT